MERRTTARISSSQAASLYLQSGEHFTCMISDFCERGMYITFDSGVLDPETHLKEVVRVSFPDENGQELFVNAKPMHISESAAGIRFVGVYGRAIDFLLRSAGQAKPLALEPEHLKVVKESLQLTETHMERELDALFPILVADFRQAALEARSDQEANARMGLADRLEKAAGRVRNTFFQELSKLDSLAPVKVKDQEDADHLSIVDKSDFEDWLLSRVLITKLETQFRHILIPLKMRTDAIEYRSPNSISSPLGPERIVYAFRSAIHSLVTDSLLEKRAFKLFEKHTLEIIEPMYEAINDLFLGCGVLPQISLKSLANEQLKQVKQSEEKNNNEKLGDERKSDARTPERSELEAAPSAPAERASVEPDKPDVPSAVPAKPQQELTDEQPPAYAYGSSYRQSGHVAHNSDHSSSLPGGGSVGAGSRAEGSEGQTAQPGFRDNQEKARHAYESVTKLVRSMRRKADSNEVLPSEQFSAQELESGLQGLQQMIPEAGVDPEGLSLLDRVLGTLQQTSGNEKGLDEQQQVTIDVVDRFFVSLKDNPRISDSAKTQLTQLEIPVLRQMLENEEFFSGEHSPLRDVLNRIAKLGSKGGRLGKVGQQKIQQLIHKINIEYDSDKTVVDTVKRELDELLEKQQALYLKNVDRVAAAAEGVHRVDEAKKHVSREVSALIASKKTPAALQLLFDQGWLDHLKLSLLKGGDKSTAYTEGLAVVDGLVNYAENPESGFDAKRFLPTIQDGLRQVSGGNEASTKVRDALKQLLLDAPMGKHELVEAGNIIVGKAVEQESLEEANLKKSKVLKAWIRRAKSIPVDAWLKFQKEDQEPQFMRLVWVADGYTKFVFVNHQGMKVIELGLFKLAQYLKTGDVMPDPDYDLPIVNQGLDNMVKDVYEKLAFESSHDKETGLVNSHEFVRAIKKDMQQGARTNPCCILYVRLFMSGLSEEQEASARAPIEQVLTTLDKEGNLAARLNRYDFAAFVSGSDSELSVGLWADQVRLAYSEMTSLSGADQALQFKMSESWGYLGFNNPNTLLSGAVDALETAELCASSNAKVELELPEQAIDEGDTNAACRVNAQSLEMFKVYKQHTRKVNDQALLSEQLKLICTLADEDLPFVPEDKAEATAMGQWWINYFVKQQVALADVETDRTLRIPISAHTLLDEDFKAELIQALKAGKLDAQKVWFDVSEGYLIQNEHEAADIIRELQFLGFHVALDKFGTSECPFRLLQVLPVDMIIIDEAYAQESALEDEEKEGAVQSVVEVAHHFEKAVLADGVDSAICLQRMQRQHVDFVQGETISHYELLTEA